MNPSTFQLAFSYKATPACLRLSKDGHRNILPTSRLLSRRRRCKGETVAGPGNGYLPAVLRQVRKRVGDPPRFTGLGPLTSLPHAIRRSAPVPTRHMRGRLTCSETLPVMWPSGTCTSIGQLHKVISPDKTWHTDILNDALTTMFDCARPSLHCNGSMATCHVPKHGRKPFGEGTCKAMRPACTCRARLPGTPVSILLI